MVNPFVQSAEYCTTPNVSKHGSPPKQTEITMINLEELKRRTHEIGEPGRATKIDTGGFAP